MSAKLKFLTRLRSISDFILWLDYSLWPYSIHGESSYVSRPDFQEYLRTYPPGCGNRNMLPGGCLWGRDTSPL